MGAARSSGAGPSPPRTRPVPVSTVAAMFLFRLVFSPFRIALFVVRLFGFSRVVVFLLGSAALFSRREL